LGGWYAYRASKAALNMLIKTAGIELARTRPQTRLLTLHPGTVISGLSQPFKGASAARLASLAARELLSLIDRLAPADSGNFFAYNGERLPW
jgi:NAD(P)-dependent dehydrogenase (short-subunit alcohol dehydrogenase family)